jgi:hypothetical protein
MDESMTQEWTAEALHDLVNAVGWELAVKTINAALADEQQANRGLYRESNERYGQIKLLVKALEKAKQRFENAQLPWAALECDDALAQVKEAK